MKFTDTGYIIATRRHGESGLIVTAVCQNYGKVCGYVKSGFSKRNFAVFQLGNKVQINAYSRVDENMLSLDVELISPDAVNFIVSASKLQVLSCFCTLCNLCLAELQPLEEFYDYIDNFIKQIDKDNWLTYYSFFEFYLLDTLGIGLDLSECAACKTKEHLAFISPKSAKAVCLNDGLPYKSKLFNFPEFILNKNYFPTREELVDLLNMTEFFLKKNFFNTHNLKFPLSRVSLAQIIA